MRASAFLSVYAFVVLLLLSPFLASVRPSIAAARETPPLYEDGLLAPQRSAGLAASEEQRGPSQYLAGSVAVQLVLPESNGASDPSTENWTPAQVAAVSAQVQQALDWWTAQLPLARLRFELQVDLVPSDYEPVGYGLADEGRWIGNTLEHLGFSGTNYFEQAYNAADALRAQRDTDWATLIFVVNSDRRSGGYLPDGRFAYAYINGPFSVITSDAGDYGTARLASVVSHELGHSFGALDQYAAARIPCERRSGYLDAPTSNSQFNNCGSAVPSIMLESLGAFITHQIDPAAQAQLGYRDQDGDGLIDPLDTAPALELRVGELAAGSGRPLLHGSSHDVAFPSAAQQQVTVNTVHVVEYRVDGGAWQPTAPDDGAFNSADEDFSAELPLYDGVYQLELRAVNSVGVASQSLRRQIEVQGVGAQPAYRVSAATVTARPELEVQLDAPAATQALQISVAADFADAAWQLYAPRVPLRLNGTDGPHKLYVRFRDQAGLVSLAYQLDTILDTQAPTGWARRDPADPTRLLLAAQDNGSGVTAVEVQVGEQSTGWAAYSTMLHVDGAGELPLRVRFRDDAGNISPLYTALEGYQIALPLLVR